MMDGQYLNMNWNQENLDRGSPIKNRGIPISKFEFRIELYFPMFRKPGKMGYSLTVVSNSPARLEVLFFHNINCHADLTYPHAQQAVDCGWYEDEIVIL